MDSFRGKRSAVWAAMLAPQLAHFGMAVVLTGRVPLTGPRLLLPAVFGIAAFGLALAATVLRGRALEMDSAPAEKSGEASGACSRGLGLWIAVWGLDDGIGFLGLILALLGQPLAVTAGFFVAGLLLLIWHR